MPTLPYWYRMMHQGAMFLYRIRPGVYPHFDQLEDCLIPNLPDDGTGVILNGAQRSEES